ncbi:PIN domain-containing protein [Microaerobacter geothermalis]|uniref:PIN domain-containing protein n=1 Tax=Microaerobacter geothermalis TaxID=674972 RepID=UPI001F2C0FDF|nr:PIN domain-containing protein [Microaerobacter geothermalis]MCF6093255.1 PIN domain-containing protein [Microaerobacter geothermalis]
MKRVEDHMEHFFLDANIIIRFLANDDQNQSPIAYSLFEKATKGEVVLHLSPMIVAECSWVLQSKRYGYSKIEIAERLLVLIQAKGIKAEEKEILIQSLKYYSELNVDFIDAYLAVYSKVSDVRKVITWNKKHFKKLDVEVYSPKEIVFGE